jgi:DNA-3-methyladenine glycosylase
LDIDRRHDGLDLLTTGPIGLEQVRRRALPGRLITRSARVGVAYAGDWAHRPLRFCVAGNPHVSRP